MKPFYRSKTFWFNLLSLLVIIASNFGYEGFTPDMWVNELGTVIILTVNLALRFMTKEPVTLGIVKSSKE